MLNKLYFALNNIPVFKDTQEKNYFVQKKPIYIIAFCLCMPLISFDNVAEPYVPSKDEAVAQWDASIYSDTKTLETITEHLQEAQFPGQANIHHSMALSILLHLSEEQQNNSEYWYLLARSLQHQHEFEQALIALDKALTIEANLPTAWLLKANILMTKANFEEAKQACTQLIGNTSLVMVATCSLEVASYQGALTESYKQLSLIIERANTTSYTVDESLWRVQVIADMALRLNLPEEAAQWLATALKHKPLTEMPLSFITLWTDIQRELGAHHKIQTQLSAILEQASFKDDALLVRVAMAEKATKTNTGWQAQTERRVNLRLQRQDYYHAADIARYFLYVKPSPEKALMWAKVNYEQAQLFDDEKLLKAAQQLNKINGQVGEKNVSE